MSTALQSTPTMPLPETSVESSQIIVTITVGSRSGSLGIKNNTYATDKGDEYVRIVAVKPNSPADIAGIKVGDIPVLYEGGKVMNRIPPGVFSKMKNPRSSYSPSITFSVMRNIPSMAEQRKQDDAVVEKKKTTKEEQRRIELSKEEHKRRIEMCFPSMTEQRKHQDEAVTEKSKKKKAEEYKRRADLLLEGLKEQDTDAKKRKIIKCSDPIRISKMIQRMDSMAERYKAEIAAMPETIQSKLANVLNFVNNTTEESLDGFEYAVQELLDLDVKPRYIYWNIRLELFSHEPFGTNVTEDDLLVKFRSMVHNIKQKEWFIRTKRWGSKPVTEITDEDTERALLRLMEACGEPNAATLAKATIENLYANDHLCANDHIHSEFFDFMDILS